MKLEIVFKDGERIEKTLPEIYDRSDVHSIVGVMTVGTILSKLFFSDGMAIENVYVKEKETGEVVFDLSEQLNKLKEAFLGVFSDGEGEEHI